MNDTHSTPRAPRAVRSFVRREGRMTTSQRRALEALADTYRWPLEPRAPATITGRCAPLWLEVGCGDGENVLAAARAHPARDHLACEVHGPGVGHLLNGIAQAGLTNLRVARCDVFDLLKTLPAESLAAVSVFFPDPWPKKRHHKRRLLQASFFTELARVLARNGRLYVATDWSDSAEEIAALVETLPAWCNLAGPGRRAPRLKTR
ncbi:MAG: tRNA (guanosine(46)-N7)-methyltransferase TrmB, partial [Gammaproteobacteria bacterium]